MEIALTENELVVVRGAICESVGQARRVPNGTETRVYDFLISAYRKVIEKLEALQPGRPEHAFHRKVLKGGDVLT